LGVLDFFLDQRLFAYDQGSLLDLPSVAITMLLGSGMAKSLELDSKFI
jgi:hypothetical protein